MTRTLVPAFLASLLLLNAGCPASDSGDGDEITHVADAGVVDPDVETLSLDEGTFTVGAGEEVSYCVKLPMPKKFKGRQLALVGWESDVPVPTHHYFMTYTSESTPGSEPVPCQGDSGVLPQTQSGEAFATSGVLNTKLLFAVGVGKQKQLTEKGYGAVIDADGSFVTNHHVLNTSDEDAELHGRFKLSVMDAELVPHPVRTLVCSMSALNLPAGKVTSTTLTCLAPFDIDLVMMAGHGHALLSGFQAHLYQGDETRSEVLYESHQWDSPEVKTFSEPLHLKKGEGITFTCEHRNMTEKAVKFGLTGNDEMCVLFAGYALPEGHDFEIPPPLFAAAYSAGKPVTVADSTKTPLFF